MRCLIVDDEPLARQLLESYLEKIDGMTLVRSCSNAVDVFEALLQNPVDLIFLDIEMPNTSGIELLRSLQTRPLVILTTAYREYAFDAYNLDVIDYMLKPVSFDRFLRGMAKIRQLKQYEAKEVVAGKQVSYEDSFLYLKENREMIKVFLKDILFIEALRDYVRVKTISREVITYQKISYLEQKLPQRKFVRVHRSFIVARDKVISFSTDKVMVNENEIPLGRNYKKPALAALKDEGGLRL